MPTLYSIRDWDDNFENNRTRGMKATSWVPVPNKHDGEGLQTIFEQPDGIVIYGAWNLILQVASKCTPRGTLVRRDGTPLTAHAIAIKTGWNHPDNIQRALDFCSTEQVGWLQVVSDDPAPPCRDTAPSCASRARAEGKGKERKGKEGKGIKGGDAPPSADADTSKEDINGTKGTSNEFDQFISEWNEMAPTAGLATVLDASPKRRTAFVARMKVPIFRNRWQEAMAKIPNIPFLCGKGRDGWKININFFLKPDSVVKILEGSYESATDARKADGGARGWAEGPITA